MRAVFLEAVQGELVICPPAVAARLGLAQVHGAALTDELCASSRGNITFVGLHELHGLPLHLYSSTVPSPLARLPLHCIGDVGCKVTGQMLMPVFQPQIGADDAPGNFASCESGWSLPHTVCLCACHASQAPELSHASLLAPACPPWSARSGVGSG